MNSIDFHVATPRRTEIRKSTHTESEADSDAQSATEFTAEAKTRSEADPGAESKTDQSSKLNPVTRNRNPTCKHHGRTQS